MANPKIRVHNVETGEVIDRDMTAEEIAQWQADQDQISQRDAELAAKAAQKLALLDRLGITQDEANLLLS